MESINFRTALAGLGIGALLTAGAATLVNRHAEPTPETPATEAAVPAAEVPGYAGPVYDSKGKLVGYAHPQTVEQPAVTASTAPVARYRSAPTATTTTVAPAKQGRSTAKSVAIVGGSAGAGAAIGAVAGGGKGAAIGALSGGTAGFIYDRLTHKK